MKATPPNYPPPPHPTSALPHLQSSERDLYEGVDEVLLGPDEVLQGSHDGRVHARQAVGAVHAHDVLGALPLRRHAVGQQEVPAKVEDVNYLR